MLPFFLGRNPTRFWQVLRNPSVNPRGFQNISFFISQETCPIICKDLYNVITNYLRIRGKHFFQCLKQKTVRFGANEYDTWKNPASLITTQFNLRLWIYSAIWPHGHLDSTPSPISHPLHSPPLGPHRWEASVDAGSVCAPHLNPWCAWKWSSDAGLRNNISLLRESGGD